MKKHFVLPILLAAAAVAAPAARAELKLPRVSPSASVSQTVGLTDMTVTYSRPGVKGRVIWGGLVPYDKPWRTGANEATTFTCSEDVVFGEQALPAGTYSLLTIPTEGKWTVVLNSESELWGAFAYKPEKDVMRVTVRPSRTPENEEWMRFSFENLTTTSAELVLRWENLRLAVPITVNVNTTALANARAAMAEAKPDDWRTPYQTASFCFNNDVATDEGRKWLKKSLGVKKTYLNLSLLARWQMKDGKKEEAIASAKEAVAAGKAGENPMDTSATERLLEEWTAAQ